MPVREPYAKTKSSPSTAHELSIERVDGGFLVVLIRRENMTAPYLSPHRKIVTTVDGLVKAVKEFAS